MKKILSLLLVLLTCLSLFGCAKDEIPNPVKQYSSLQEINNKAGVYIVSPGVMGKTDEVFYIIDNNTASYAYKLNGYYYYIRGTKDLADDMSGIFKNGRLLFEDNQDQIAYGEAEGYKVYRFFIGSRQYIFGVEDKDTLDKELFDQQFKEVYNDILYACTPDDVKKLAGDYQDSTSQRATMHIDLIDVDELLIDITWSNSATEYEEWIANAKTNGSKASYDSIVHYLVTVDENEKINSETLGDYEAGYFEIKNEKFLWTGSGNKLTSSCVFEKVN